MDDTRASLNGVIHGRTIELEHELDLPDGQSVAVTVQPVAGTGRLAPGEGIKRSAGSWADDPKGLEEYLEQLRQAREQDRLTIEP